MSRSEDILLTISPVRVRKRYIVLTAVLALGGATLFCYGYFFHAVEGEVVNVAAAAKKPAAKKPETPPADPGFNPESMFGDDDQGESDGSTQTPGADNQLTTSAPPQEAAPPPVEPETVVDQGELRHIREAILTEAITYGQYELTEQGMPRLLQGKAKAACPT